MDPSLYKDLTVQRGLKYRYYASAAAAGKPTLLFLHGFPSTSFDWHRQVSYLQPLGYGIVAPDLLGAGGTAKPLDVQAFRANAMARDIMDILAAEGVGKVIAVAHDWGSPFLSRFALLYPEAFLGYAWLAVAYMEPITVHFDIEAMMAYTKQVLGYEAYAYWQFFLRDDAHEFIHKNIDAFVQLLYANKAEDWQVYMATRGKTAELIEGNLQLGRPSYLSDQEYTAIRDAILADGIRSALNWYRVQNEDVNLEDCLNTPKENWKLRSPSLVILALKDYVCTPVLAKASMEKYGGPDVEYVEVNSGHWPHLEHTDQVNAALRRWLEARVW